MSLQPCRECASRVSTEAPVCPHCGVPEPTRGAGPAIEAGETGGPHPRDDPTAWRYLQGDVQRGPRTRAELLELLRTGEISPETRVKSDAMPYWMPAKLVPELGAEGAAGPGAPPPNAGARPGRPVHPARSGSSALRTHPPAEDERQRSARTVAAVGYGLQAAGFLTCVSLLVAVVVAYLKRDDVEGSWLHSHFQWQINTFWYLMLWVAGALLVSAVLRFSTVGFGVLWFPSAIWFIYRVVHGWLRLNDGDRV